MPVQRLLEFCMNLLSRSSEFKVNDSFIAEFLASYISQLFLILESFSFSHIYFGANLYHLFGFLWTQADAFAKNLGYGSALRAGLIKLQVG